MYLGFLIPNSEYLHQEEANDFVQIQVRPITIL